MKPYHRQPSLCWVCNLLPGLIASGLNRRWRTCGEHELNCMMGGLSVKANLTDVRDFAQGHAWQFYVQIHNQLAHIWWQTPSLSLFMCNPINTSSLNRA